MLSVVLPVPLKPKNKAELSEREILYKVLFDMKKDLNELKKITFELMQKEENQDVMNSINARVLENENQFGSNNKLKTIDLEESLSLFDQEKKLIEKSLNKHKGKRKNAAEELGISERTLYRKIKEFGI